MVLRKAVFLPLAFVIFPLFVCGNRNSEIVARVGNGVITLKEFERDFSQGKAENIIKSAGMDLKKSHLRKMIEKRLKLLDAYRNRLDEDKVIIEKLKEVEKKAAYNGAYEKDIVDKLISEAEIKEFYDHSNLEVKARHILLKLPENPTEDEIDETRKKAEELVRKIRKGADFAQLAKIYSEDNTTASKGGDLGYFRWGAKVDEFQRVAFALKVGQVSDPVRTKFGYHIIKVEDRRKFLKKDYNSEKPRIRRLLARAKKKDLQLIYQDYVGKVKKQYRVRFYNNNIAAFARRLAEAQMERKKESSAVTGPWDQFSKVRPEERKLVLVTHRVGQITVGDVINVIENRYPPYAQPQLQDEKGIKQWLDWKLGFDLVAHKGYIRRLHESKQLQRSLQVYKEQLLLNEIQKRKVLDKIEISEDDLREYFERHKEEYEYPRKVKVQEILVNDNELAQSIAKRALKGEDFTKLARKYNQRTISKNKDGHLGYITKGAYGRVGQKAFTMKVGEISGPIAIGRMYSILKVLDIQEPRPKIFEEAKAEVEADLRRELISSKVIEWVARLKKLTKIRIYEEPLKRAFSDLKVKTEDKNDL